MSRLGPAAAPLPEPDRPAGLVVDARMHLLDRQVQDRTGRPVGTVDDVELELGPDGTWRVTALLAGAVLATRILGGRPPSARLHRTPWRDVADVGIVVRLGVDGDGLEGQWVERWLRGHLIARIPGGRHDPE
jgi:sporulation protein YlmC with PRC-barrel domain